MKPKHLTKRDQLSSFLKEKRLESGLSQLRVAEELGYASPQFVSNWERGLCAPAPKTFKKLARIFKIQPLMLTELYLAEIRIRTYREAGLIPKIPTVKTLSDA